MSTIPRPPVHRIILLQLSLALIAAIIAGLHSGVAALSALLGGLACALPNAYFIWRAFRFQGASQARKVVVALYQGEAWKFFLTALIFVTVFRLGIELNYFALFASFITVQLGQIFSSRVTHF
ncbi:MAG: hypothetical protein RL217_2019 [Pseudomonadota bacterium]